MTTLPIGLPTRRLPQPLRRAIAKAGELGADGVEIDARHETRAGDFTQTALRQFRKTLDDAGLRVAALAFPTRRGLGDPDGLERRLLAIREAMAFAYKVGARVVVHHAETIPDVGEASGDGAEAATLVESLALLADYGEHVGARLAIASDADPTRVAALLDRLPDDAIGVALHTGLLAAAGRSPAEAASMLGPRVLYVQAADAVRTPGAGGAEEVELGRGAAEAPEVLGALAEHDYRGWVTAERSAGPNRVADLENAVAYLRAL